MFVADLPAFEKIAIII